MHARRTHREAYKHTQRAERGGETETKVVKILTSAVSGGERTSDTRLQIGFRIRESETAPYPRIG